MWSISCKHGSSAFGPGQKVKTAGWRCQTSIPLDSGVRGIAHSETDSSNGHASIVCSQQIDPMPQSQPDCVVAQFRFPLSFVFNLQHCAVVSHDKYDPAHRGTYQVGGGVMTSVVNMRLEGLDGQETDALKLGFLGV